MSGDRDGYRAEPGVRCADSWSARCGPDEEEIAASSAATTIGRGTRRTPNVGICAEEYEVVIRESRHSCRDS